MTPDKSVLEKLKEIAGKANFSVQEFGAHNIHLLKAYELAFSPATALALLELVKFWRTIAISYAGNATYTGQMPSYYLSKETALLAKIQQALEGKV